MDILRSSIRAPPALSGSHLSTLGSIGEGDEEDWDEDNPDIPDEEDLEDSSSEERDDDVALGAEWSLPSKELLDTWRTALNLGDERIDFNNDAVIESIISATKVQMSVIVPYNTGRVKKLIQLWQGDGKQVEAGESGDGGQKGKETGLVPRGRVASLIKRFGGSSTTDDVDSTEEVESGDGGKKGEETGLVPPAALQI